MNDYDFLAWFMMRKLTKMDDDYPPDRFVVHQDFWLAIPAPHDRPKRGASFPAADMPKRATKEACDLIRSLGLDPEAEPGRLDPTKFTGPGLEAWAEWTARRLGGL